MLSISNNLPAQRVANTLTGHYGRLGTSIERLSSGLRINGADDDAAGLAIRELQRSDIAALRQGMRNVNDAISMIQTFDGALGIIDEKLIRMKELAEQAATGTYDSTQRLMIDSEFQAMGSEIDRIANATDFNGVKLLCTKMITWFTDEDKFIATNPGSVDNLQFSAANTTVPVLNNIDPSRYINENTPERTINVSLTATQGTKTVAGNLQVISAPGVRPPKYSLTGTPYTAAYVDYAGGATNPVITYNNGTWSVSDNGVAYDTISITADKKTLFGNLGSPLSIVSFSLEDNNGAVSLDALDPKVADLQVDTGAGTYSLITNTVEITNRTADYSTAYNEDTKTVTVTLANGGTVSMNLANPLNVGDKIDFELNLKGEIKTVQVEHTGVDPNQKVKIHFGTGNDSAEDYYYINYANCTRTGLGIDDVDIQTQEKAQNALVQLDDAIVTKDKIRAEYGAMQNRFENTYTNLSIQAENLQSAESRISDANIATEMMTFVKHQILTQSAVAMLAQANSMPQMVMRLIG